MQLRSLLLPFGASRLRLELIVQKHKHTCTVPALPGAARADDAGRPLHSPHAGPSPPPRRGWECWPGGPTDLCTGLYQSSVVLHTTNMMNLAALLALLWPVLLLALLAQQWAL